MASAAGAETEALPFRTVGARIGFVSEPEIYGPPHPRLPSPRPFGGRSGLFSSVVTRMLAADGADSLLPACLTQRTPASMTFSDKLRAAQAATRSRLCVGLDPDPARFPAHLAADRGDAAVLTFNTAIIDATEDLACAYKLNLAFYEALGPDGWRALADTIRAIPDERLVILDGKRGDIGNTARRYAEGAFDRLGADACTVAPYIGRDAIRPFLQHASRCAFVLVATSNESGPDLQQAEVDGQPFYRLVARMAAEEAATQPGEVGFVVGATRPELLAELRENYPDVPFLIPGVGAQGGDPGAVIAASGGGPTLVNSSRSVLYASGGADFARAARDSAEALRD